MKTGKRARRGMPGRAGASLPLPMSSAVQAAVPDVASRVLPLNGLLREQREWALRDAPEFPAIPGDYRYNDPLGNLSPAHVQQQKRESETFLRRFEAIDTTGFADQELSLDVLDSRVSAWIDARARAGKF